VKTTINVDMDGVQVSITAPTLDAAATVARRLTEAPAAVPSGLPAPRWAPSNHSAAEAEVLIAFRERPIARIEECLDGTWSWSDPHGGSGFAATRDDARRAVTRRLPAAPAPDAPAMPVQVAPQAAPPVVAPPVVAQPVPVQPVRAVAPQAPPTGLDAVEARAQVRAAQVAEGAGAFGALVRTWVQNFDVEGAPQPDRADALMGAIAGYGPAVAAYVRERGGLAGAVLDTLLRERLSPPDGAVALSKKAALNMVNVGSALRIPMDRLLERSLLLNLPSDPERPAWGGPSDATLAFNPPDEV
jgi:hypothetical protein